MNPLNPYGTDKKTRETALLLHLSQFLGYIAPVLGWVVPVIIWQVKKDEMPQINAHGKNVVNWILSQLIYWAICIVLFFVLIGIPLMMILGVLAIVFPIVGAIKGNNGEVWKYPLAIPFFK